MPTWICLQRRLPALALRRLAAPVLTIALFALTAAGASAQTASWQFTPVTAPTPPSGTAPAPFPVPLGQVGQISFWAPNRGLLVTGGTEGQNNVAATGGVVAAGVWAYDGVSWHQLSTVCGGAYGRIAWAGPDDFWTISDQRPGQLISGQAPTALTSISLCHFDNGQVVGSYAMPLGQGDSYQTMDAAACEGADDCWFGGNDPPTNSGAFELHWDGTNLTALYGPYDHSSNDMVDYQGQIYESVRIDPSDNFIGGESTEEPPVLQRIGTTETGPFIPVDPFDQTDQVTLPSYGGGVTPDALEGFALSTDAQLSADLGTGLSASQLWAAANPDTSTSEPIAGPLPTGTVFILHDSESGGWTQLSPAVAATAPLCAAPSNVSALTGDLESYLAEGQGALSDVNVADPQVQTDGLTIPTGTSTGAIAAMPGTSEAWVSLADGQAPFSTGDDDGAIPAMALIDANGCVLQFDAPQSPITGTTGLPDPAFAASSGSYTYNAAFAQSPAQSSTPGLSGPVDCPTDNDCWMATSEGWLYHYTDGTQYSQDTDPNFAGVITVRPADGATVTVYGDIPPVDDSGTSPTYVAPTGPAKSFGGGTRRIVVKLTKVRTKLVHRTELELSFHLNIRARVQILAERHGKVVARSARKVLAPGRRTLVLQLNPKRWPTHIKVDAKPEPKTAKKAKQK